MIRGIGISAHRVFITKVNQMNIPARYLFSAAVVAVLSACSSNNAAPVVSGNGYGYNNGIVNTPYGTVNTQTGAATTSSGYGYNYNNGTATTPYGTVNTQTGATTPSYNAANTQTNAVTTPYGSTNIQTNSVPTQSYTPSSNPLPTNPNPYVQNTTPYIPPVTNHAYHSSVGNYPPVNTHATHHRVESGDTVFNISKRYGISQDNLRSWNHLPDNTVKIGQVLRVKPTGNNGLGNLYAGAVAPVAVAGVVTHRVASGDTLYNIARRYNVSPSQIRVWNQLPNDTVKIGQVLRVSAAGMPAASVSAPANNPYIASNVRPAPAVQPAPVVSNTPPVATNVKNGVRWQTPLSGGRISQAFTASSHGVEISGSQGQPIMAAADGQVIYIGPLRGYKNLIVVQHTPQYLTAYSNGETLYVKDKDQVKLGQTLATLDNSGRLHFELRENGEPVNPSNYVMF